MTLDIERYLRVGDLDRAGKVGDVYWDCWSKAMGGPSPADPVYVAARTAGALAGSPMGWGFEEDGARVVDTLLLFAPPSHRDRVLAAMPGWRALPFTITPFGARVCGAF
jgi:hypothetical protein